MLSVKDMMDELKTAETKNDHRENPLRYIIMAWGGEYSLYLCEWEDRNGERKLILNAYRRSALETRYPHTVMAKVLKTTNLHREYGQWIVSASNGEEHRCLVTEEGLKEWKRASRKG